MGVPFGALFSLLTSLDEYDKMYLSLKQGGEGNMGKKVWTTDEEAYLDEHYATANIEKIMEDLDKTYMSIKRKAQEMGLTRAVYEDGYYYSTGDVMSLLGCAKSTILYYGKMKYLKYETFKSFSRPYRRYTTEQIISFLVKYPEKWLHREYDKELINILMLDYGRTDYKQKNQQLKDLLKVGSGTWKDRVGRTGNSIYSKVMPTLEEKLSAI